MEEVQVAHAETLRGASVDSSAARLRPKAPHSRPDFRLGSAEPVAAVLLRELSGPGLVTMVLLGWLWLGGSGLINRHTCALALLAFLLSQRILTPPQLRADAALQPQLQPTVWRMLLEWACIFSLFIFLVTALDLGQFVTHRSLAAWLITTPLALLASRSWLSWLPQHWSASGAIFGRHIIIGATDTGLELAKRVRQGSFRGQFLGFADFRAPLRLPTIAPEQWIGACTGIVDYVKRNAVEAIYIALPLSSEPRIADLLQQLRDTTASIYFVPANIFDFHLVHPRCIEIHGIPALAVCETPHQGLSGLGKRIFDLALGVMALLLAGPLMLLIGAAVRLSSPGPALFRQRRYGLNGEQIVVYKFRSMTVCEDGLSVTQAKRNDARTTWLGRILRRTSLDELPQILNVLEGHMSFVGPRPHAIAHNEMYRKLIGGYMVRHKVRPGITGWAQVNGFRGETETIDKMRRRIELDIDYLNSWSIWLDLRILARTVRVVLGRDRQAY